ncbi:MAG: flagellar hook protein FlgE [Burkholderiaceae bacterium]|nr:flagellar hook protein FlgE [Burkholderiaceae bacterium]
MSFQQGLSGLSASSKTLEVIGNNVANANTVGFKQSQAVFSDVYAASLTGSGNSPIGIGTRLAEVVQQFTQGNVTASNNPLDVAINGGGFFRMSNDGAVSYSRNGQFQLDRSGFIVNAEGARLTGYVADSRGILSTGAPADINIRTSDLPPEVTETVDAMLNLDSRQDVPLTTPFAMDDPTTYNNATSVSVYDSLGNAHVLQTFYVKTGAGTWDIYAAADESLINGGATIGSLAFGTDGALTAASQAALPIMANIPVTTGATPLLAVGLDYSGTTQFGASFAVNKLDQDGYTSGRLSGFGIAPDGTVMGRYTNGQSAVLGQVVLAAFANPNGLQPLGGNLWAETADSGSPMVGLPTSGNLGALQSNAVEDSNVDLTAELVNMITAQRNYQANAQTIKTQDQVMQTLVNLR